MINCRDHGFGDQLTILHYTYFYLSLLPTCSQITSNVWAGGTACIYEKLHANNVKYLVFSISCASGHGSKAKGLFSIPTNTVILARWRDYMFLCVCLCARMFTSVCVFLCLCVGLHCPLCNAHNPLLWFQHGPIHNIMYTAKLCLDWLIDFTLLIPRRKFLSHKQWHKSEHINSSC